MDKFKELVNGFKAKYQRQFSDYATMPAAAYRKSLLQKLAVKNHPLAEAALKGDLRASNMIAKLFLDPKKGFDMNKWPLTERLLQPGLRQKDAEAYFWYGMLHEHLGKYNQAAEYFAEAYHLGYAPAELYLAIALFDAGAKDDAREIAYNAAWHASPTREVFDFISFLDALPSYCSPMLEAAFYGHDVEAQTFLAHQYDNLSKGKNGTPGHHKFSEFWRNRVEETRATLAEPLTPFILGGKEPEYDEDTNLF